jgi:hypothetical protein
MGPPRGDHRAELVRASMSQMTKLLPKRCDMGVMDAMPKHWCSYGALRSHSGKPDRKYIAIRLPSWEMRYSIYSDRMTWHRLCLIWTGYDEGARHLETDKDGWHFHWIEEYRE